MENCVRLPICSSNGIPTYATTPGKQSCHATRMKYGSSHDGCNGDIGDLISIPAVHDHFSNGMTLPQSPVRRLLGSIATWAAEK